MRPRSRTWRCSSESLQELLGLTATPERADGLDVLHYFDGRIVAELRLWDAIDQQYLAPFDYYGIPTALIFAVILRWKRGQGYDVDELSNLRPVS